MRQVIVQISAPEALRKRATRLFAVKELLNNGDTGLGEGPEAESILNDGIAYISCRSGKVKMMSLEDTLAFGMAADFDTSTPIFRKEKISSLKELEKAIGRYTDPDAVWLMKGRGRFLRMILRDGLRPGDTTTAEGEYGNLVGVYCPQMLEGLNQPGWRFHFLSTDCRRGGYVEELSAESLEWQLNRLDEIDVILSGGKTSKGDGKNE